MDNEELVSFKYTATERGTWKRCHSMHDYASFNRQGLTSRVATLPLNLGTLHHQTMDAWCEYILNKENNANICRTCKGLGSILSDEKIPAQTSDPEVGDPVYEIATTCPNCNGTREEPTFDPLAAMDQVSTEMIKGITDNYKRVVGSKINRSELTSVFEAVEFGRAMIQMYADYWGSPIAPEFNLIKSEQTIVVPVCTAPCVYCDGSGRLRVPGLDSIICHVCNGRGIVRLELEGTLDFIVQHKEIGYYCVGERKTYDKRPNPSYLRFFDQGSTYVWMLSHLVSYEQIAGIAYDGMWRRKEVPKGKTMDDLFLRTLLLRNPHEMERFSAHIIDELRDMHTSKVYTNRRWEGCYDCQFRRLCDAETLGEDTEYIRQTFYMKRPRTNAFVLEEEE